MRMKLRTEADGIIQESRAAVLLDAAVKKSLTEKRFDAGGVVLVAACIRAPSLRTRRSMCGC